MNNKTILVVAAIIVVLGAGYALAGSGHFWNLMGSYGNGNSMMGSYGNGNGMMGSYGNGNGMMGEVNGFEGEGMCGVASPETGTNAAPITINEARTSVEKYLAGTGNTDLEIAEVLQFEKNYYAGIKEKSTGKYAFELLVNKNTGAVYPEMGPNMMWNAKYGHMSNTGAIDTVTEEQALKVAQEYLDKNKPGSKVNSADTFYGYYTMEVTENNTITGMLSVNSNTGAVWYHTWHGAFEKLLEVN
ncbi:MAG: hypothetical protein OIN87_02405 [Candidatus Methanoperedens sp.]|nr:hypothetical protein [Candidatus Methanoperedens sp.]